MWWNQKLRIRTIEYSRIRRFKSVACISHSLSIIRAPLVTNRVLNVAGLSAPILHVDTDTGDMSAPAEPVRRISRFKGHVPTSNDQESGHGITMPSPGMSCRSGLQHSRSFCPEVQRRNQDTFLSLRRLVRVLCHLRHCQPMKPCRESSASAALLIPTFFP